MSSELQTLRHSASHVMAQAVKRLFPDVKLAIGPAIDTGFYYDFDTEHTFTPEDLEAIEKEMKKIAKENLKIERFELPKEEALELMKDEPYKIELINDLPEGEVISFYKQGEFCDLCAGPHINYTSKVKAYKLLSATRCCRESTVRHLKQRTSWKNILLIWKRLKSATITSSDVSWSSLPHQSLSVRDCRYFCLRAQE